MNELNIQTNSNETNDSKDENIQSCCLQTIKTLATHNPMMVCQQCKRIIKSFHKANEFRNYVRFCQSRGRIIETKNLNSHYIVIFSPSYVS